MPDDLPEPPTLADVQSYSVDVFCWCNRCRHHAVLSVAVLIADCGLGLPFPMIHGGLRRQACGSNREDARLPGICHIYGRLNSNGTMSCVSDGSRIVQLVDGDFSLPAQIDQQTN
jgi:hypothetical protein